MDPERVHRLVLDTSSFVGRIPLGHRLLQSILQVTDSRFNQTIAGIKFENPLGLAAGFDKNGTALEIIGSLGFGHAEIGSISAYPSSGNSMSPRLFRLPDEEAVVVAYGVPNDGASVVANRIMHRFCAVPLGVNLVKTNDPKRPSVEAEVLHDYSTALEQLQPHADYINLNMSCPNSAEDRNYFDDIPRVAGLLDRLADSNPQVPIFLKLKPTSDRGWLKELVAIARSYSFIAGFGINLPAGKPPGLRFRTAVTELDKMPGAVSGRPVQDLINGNLKILYETIGRESRFHLMAAGGVFSGEDAYLKLQLGASLVQLYTVLIYEGPSVVSRILQQLQYLFDRDGVEHISQVVGVAHRN